MRWMLLVLCLFPAALTAETFAGGPSAPTVIELYTSEGCNSCPPADRWLASLRDEDALFTSVYPLAFHVDYWDRLGWPDRFARAAFSQRQRRYHSQNSLSAVYTPCVLASGREWRGWRKGESWPRGKGTPGVLRLQLEKNRIRVVWEGERQLRLHLAWIGMGLSTEVKRGENAGKTLEHEFVVLARVQRSRGRSWNLPVRIPRRGQKRTALVAWVSDPDQQGPVQAAGGYLPPEQDPVRDDR
jgi:hypothetical protein